MEISKPRNEKNSIYLTPLQVMPTQLGTHIFAIYTVFGLLKTPGRAGCQVVLTSEGIGFQGSFF